MTARGSLRAALGLDLAPMGPGRRGDPGLFGPGSEVWRVARERAILAGGPAALLLQLAHPLVAAGVSAHSEFRRDPLARLRETLQATLTITFGDSAQARAAADRVAATHRRVKGSLDEDVGGFPAGTPYRAQDPELALWVFATLVVTGIWAVSTFVGGLGPERRARYYVEGKPFAGLFGVGPDLLPPDYPAFRAYVAQIVAGPTLSVGRTAAELAREVLRVELPWPSRPLAALPPVLTAAALPARLREAYGLSWGWRERSRFRAVRAASRVVIRSMPGALRYWPHYGVAERRVAS